MNALHASFARAGAAALALALACGAACAAPAPGISFTHKDWSLDCDNTGTCRASGYETDDDIKAPVSVLITRPAGPGAKVDAKVQFGTDDEGNTVEGPVAMTIAGHASGTVVDSADLTEAQVAALVKAMTGTGAVVFRKGKAHWTLSGEGAAAVLVKMDDVQGRIGTPGALVKKGPKPESAVPGPVKSPVIQAVRATVSNKSDVPLAKRVLATVGKTADCDELTNPETKNDPNAEPPELWRLGSGRVLVAALCWRGAYNAGNGYWIAHDKPPYDAKLVTVQADTFDPESAS